jgi:hypothetical protein
MKMKPFKLSEIIKLLEGLASREKELSSALKKVASTRKHLHSIIKNYSGHEDTLVILPTDFFKDLQPISENKKTQLNWKQICLDVISNYDGFLSTEDIYTRAKIKYSVELIDKRRSIRNFSSALHYLKKEFKVNRFRGGTKNEYLYGLGNKHFDSTGQPKKEYLKRKATAQTVA